MTLQKLEIQLYKKNPFLTLFQKNSIEDREQYLPSLEKQLLLSTMLEPKFCVSVKDRIDTPILWSPFLFSARLDNSLHAPNDFEASEKPSGVVLK